MSVSTPCAASRPERVPSGIPADRDIGAGSGASRTLRHRVLPGTCPGSRRLGRECHNLGKARGQPVLFHHQSQPAFLAAGNCRRDIQAGRSAGAITAAALWGYLGPEEVPTDWGADYQMENPEVLIELVSELMPCAP